jgi:hypothetical protein
MILPLKFVEFPGKQDCCPCKENAHVSLTERKGDKFNPMVILEAI